MEFDKDLKARQEARKLAKEAEIAQKKLAKMTQGQIDAIVEEIAKAFYGKSEELAVMAVRETGCGNAMDKAEKNRFASRSVAEAVRGMKTVGVINRDIQHRVWEIAVPVGVIAAIVPSTNPTSTVCYKAIIALKSGNSIIFSPHPNAFECTLEAARIVAEAAERAGAPKGAVSCMTAAGLDGCNELMKVPEVKLILATGGAAMVKAAYSSGKPAIGVGAGNGPAYIHHTADIGKAMENIVRSKTFDNGTVCASEQSIITEKRSEAAVVSEGVRRGMYFMTTEEAESLASLLFRANGTLSPKVVGKTAVYLAEMAGFKVPKDTKILVARENEAGPSVPYSMEKLCPVLAFYVMENEEAILEKCVEILMHEGSGHTFSMHAEDESVIEKFAAAIPVSRFLVNTPSALGGIGLTTGLFPALTLGCGAVGGSSSSDNISPLNLINIRSVAWGDCGSKEKACFDDGLVEMITARILEKLK